MSPLAGVMHSGGGGGGTGGQPVTKKIAATNTVIAANKPRFIFTSPSPFISSFYDQPTAYQILKQNKNRSLQVGFTIGSPLPK